MNDVSRVNPHNMLLSRWIRTLFHFTLLTPICEIFRNLICCPQSGTGTNSLDDDVKQTIIDAVHKVNENFGAPSLIESVKTLTKWSLDIISNSLMKYYYVVNEVKKTKARVQSRGPDQQAYTDIQRGGFRRMHPRKNTCQNPRKTFVKATGKTLAEKTFIKTYFHDKLSPYARPMCVNVE